MNNYFDEVNSRWKKVSVEIKSVQSMLEEVIECWRRYNACVDLLTVWLSDGEQVMSRSPEEKQVICFISRINVFPWSPINACIPIKGTLANSADPDLSLHC